MYSPHHASHHPGQIDEFLETGKFAVLEEEGGEAAQLPSKAAADAAPFLNI